MPPGDTIGNEMRWIQTKEHGRFNYSLLCYRLFLQLRHEGAQDADANDHDYCAFLRWHITCRGRSLPTLRDTIWRRHRWVVLKRRQGIAPIPNVTSQMSVDFISLWRTVVYLGIFIRVGGSINSVEDRGERGSVGGSPLVRGSGGSCNLVQEISFHIVKFS